LKAEATEAPSEQKQNCILRRKKKVSKNGKKASSGVLRNRFALTVLTVYVVGTQLAYNRA
jgi:hypothetical protein